MKDCPFPPSRPEEHPERRLQCLSRIYELTSKLMVVEDVDKLLKRIAESVREIFGFDLVGISILDDRGEYFVPHALAGYSPEEEKELVMAPRLFARESILRDFRPDCKVSNIAYYIPVEKHGAPSSEFVVVRDRKAAEQPRRSMDAWHELDLLYFALLSRRGEVIGYLQVDYPMDGLIPSVETIGLIELFANLAAVAIENSNMYRRTLDLLQENEEKAQRIFKILDLLRSVVRVDDIEVVLQKVSDAMAATFEFRKTGVSLFSRNSNRVTVHSLTGYTPEEERAVRSSVILKDKILEDFREEFRVTKTGYFIPGEHQGNGSSFVFIEDPKKALQPRKSPDSWHELDLLYFAMYDRDGEMLGYIQLDYPKNGKIPTKETMEAMEAFASIATIAVENSKIYTEMEEARNQVGMYLDLLTHDVASLINPVNAYLEMVISATDVTPIQHKYLTSAQEAARSIAHLVRNVRRSAQILETAGTQLVPVNMTKAIRDAAYEARNIFLSREIDLRLSLPDHDVYVMADNLLGEVIYNLLTNAIKYDEHEQAVVDVELTVVEHEGRRYAKVRVIDRGIGIPDELKDKVFSREFKKLLKPDRPILQKARGAGMGLSLVKALIERYGGKIWVENRVYDDYTRGSVFAFMVPMP